MDGTWGREEGIRLTRCTFNPLGLSRLVLPRRLPNSFVARRQRHHGQDGDHEGEGPRYAPLAEDDAEVGGVPCEEHLEKLILVSVLC